MTALPFGQPVHSFKKPPSGGFLFLRENTAREKLALL
jgi:hypothetical protein